MKTTEEVALTELSRRKKQEKLIEYYENIGLQIIGLNDITGLNTTLSKKGFLEHLAINLTSQKLTPETINAFSLIINKTEHIDYFLENNLSLEEIKLSQIYSTIEYLNKIAKDNGIPKLLESLINIQIPPNSIKKDDNQKFLTTTIKRSKEPTIIYSSGIPNFIKEINSNPFSISYNDNLQKIIDGVKRNFENILSLNRQADIYALGKYTKRKESIFLKEIEKNYNEKLKELCKTYNLTYIDINKLNKLNALELVNLLIDHMYETKIITQRKQRNHINSNLFITNEGPEGIIEAINYDYNHQLSTPNNLSEFEKALKLKELEEYKIEEKVLKKVLQKSTTTRRKI